MEIDLPVKEDLILDTSARIPVGLLDPSLEQGGEWDINTGDLIIAESVTQALEDRCGFKISARVPSLRKLGKKHFNLLKGCKYVFVGGTNLLSSHMASYKQWIVNLWDTFHLNNVILLGVGWWQYQAPPDLYTRILLKRVLSRKALHSVRDLFSKLQLEAAGIRNVVNTSCPTLWNIRPELQKEIPEGKAEEVLTTVTSYRQNQEEDSRLLRLLRRLAASSFWTPTHFRSYRISPAPWAQPH